MYFKKKWSLSRGMKARAAGRPSFCNQYMEVMHPPQNAAAYTDGNDESASSSSPDLWRNL